MLVEKRTYTLHAGRMAEFLSIYEAEGLAIHTRYLDLVGYFTSEIGPLNQVITMWRYDSMQQRDERRGRLYADPAWIAFGPKTTDFIQSMESMIMRPTRFSPLR